MSTLDLGLIGNCRTNALIDRNASIVWWCYPYFDSDPLCNALLAGEQTEDSHGRIDVLFANAGGGTLGAFGTVTEADFDRTVSTNLKGTFFTVQTLLPLIVDGGSIILNGSIAASLGMPAFTVYSATKAAIRSFARTWTKDLSARRIRVNTLAPGTIITPIMTEQAGFSEEQRDAFYEQFAAETPLGRNGDPSEIASVATFLASAESSFVTGIELSVDGGYAQV